MNEKTRLNVSMAVHGLDYSADLLEQALGGNPGRNQQQVWDGPFAQALHRIAEVSDGAHIQDIEQVRRDLLYCFGFLHFLRGGFHATLWDILAPAHERVADLIMEAEARELLNAEIYSDPMIDARLGYLHILVRRIDQERWQTYNATFLGRPLEGLDYRYAGYEVRALAESRQAMYVRRKAVQSE